MILKQLPTYISELIKYQSWLAMKNNVQLTSWQALRNGMASTGKVMLKSLFKPTNLVTAGVGTMIAVIYKTNQAIKEVRERADELSNSFNNNKSDIEGYKDKIKDLYKTINDSGSSLEEVTTARQTLMTVQEDLIDKFGDEKETIDLVTQAIYGQSSALDELIQKKWQETKNEFNESDMWNDYANWQEGYSDNIDRMVHEMENAWGNIKMSTSDYFGGEYDDIIKRLEEAGWKYSSSSETFVKGGSVEDLYEEILDIQTLVGDDMPDNFLKSLTNDANELKATLDNYEGMWDNYILNDRIFADKNLADSWKEINDAYSEYKDAFATGDEESIKKAQDNFANILTQATEGVSDESVVDFFNDMYPSLQEVVGNWQFETNFTANTDGLKDDVSGLLSGLDGLYSYDLKNFSYDTATEEQKASYDGLISVARLYGLTIDQLIDKLALMGLVQDENYQKLVDLFGQDAVDKLTPEDLEIAYTISSKEADKALEQEKNKIKSELESLSKEGNVDLTIRPVIDSSAMQAAGWDVEDGSIATTFTQGEFIWQGDEENGQYVYVHYTPILPDGTVLTPDELTDYLYGTLEGSQSVLDADNKGIVLKVDTDLNIPEGDIKKFINGEGSTDAIDGLIQKTGEWDDKVHGVQEQYYDTGEGVKYVSNALDGLIEKHKELESGTDLFSNLLSSKEALEDFISAVESASNAYSTLMNPNVSTSDMLSSILSITEAVSEMGGKLNWEFIESSDNSLKLLGDTIDYVSEKYTKSALVDAGFGEEFAETLANSIVESQKAARELENVNTQIDSFQTAYDDLTDIVSSYNKTGYITFDQLQTLLELEPQYLACLVDENGQLQLNQQAMAALANQRLNDAETQAVQQAIAELGVLSLQDEKTAVEENTQAFSDAVTDLSLYNTELANTIAETSVAATAIRDLNAAISGAESKGASDNQIDTVLNNLDTKLQLIADTRDGLANSFGKIVSSSTSSAPDYNSILDKEINALEKSYEAGKITFKDYLDQRKKLVEKYYHDKKITTEEYYTQLEDLAQAQVDYYDEVLAAVTRRIDREIDDIQIIIDSLQAQIDKLNKQKDTYDAVINAVLRRYDKEIDGINDLIEKLEKQNESLEKQIENYESVINAVVRRYDEEIDSINDAIESIEKQNEELEKQKENYESVINAVVRRYDKEVDNINDIIETLKKENDELDKQQDNYDGTISAIVAFLNSQKDAIQDNIDSINEENESIQDQIDKYGQLLNAVTLVFDEQREALQSEQDAIDERIEALTRENDEHKKAIELEKAKDALYKARNQRTKFLYSGEDRGFIYTQDSQAIVDAEQNLSDLNFNATVDALEKEKELLQDIIDQLGETEKAWQKISTAFDDNKSLSAAEFLFGEDYKDIILNGDPDTIANIMNQYTSAQQKLEDNDALIESYEEQMEQFDAMIEKWNSVASAKEEATNRENAALLLGEDWQSIVLANRETDFEDFMSKYLAIQEQVDNNQSLIDSYEEKITYYENLKSEWEDLTSAYQEMLDDKIAADTLGANWEDQIQNGRLVAFDSFKTKYLNIQAQINDNQSTIDSFNEKVTYYENLKSEWNDLASKYQEMLDDKMAKDMLGADWEDQLHAGRLVAFDNFKVEYLNIQAQVNDNQSTIDSYNEKVEYYENLKSEWENLSSAYQEMLEDKMAKDILGANWEDQIHNGRLVAFDSFKNNYLSIQAQIDDNQSLIDSYNEKVDYYNKLKDQWGSITDELQIETDEQKLIEEFGRDYENIIFSDRIDNINAFKEKYKAAQNELARAAEESAQRQIAAAKSVEGLTTTVPTTVPTTVSGGGANLTSNRLKYEMYHGGLDEGYVGSSYRSMTEEEKLDVLRKASVDGLNSNEVPAILKNGELVLTPEQISGITYCLMAQNYGGMLKNMTTEVQKQNVNVTQQITITLPNVTNNSGYERLAQEISAAKLLAYQRSFIK